MGSLQKRLLEDPFSSTEWTTPVPSGFPCRRKIPLISSVALLWTCPNRSMPFLYWGPQTWIHFSYDMIKVLENWLYCQSLQPFYSKFNNLKNTLFVEVFFWHILSYSTHFEVLALLESKVQKFIWLYLYQAKTGIEYKTMYIRLCRIWTM